MSGPGDYELVSALSSRLLRDPGLGAVPQAHFASGHLQPQAGYTLLGYSGGLLECRNEHDEEFGVEGLVRELFKPAPSTLSELLLSIIGAAQDFASSTAREDDCSRRAPDPRWRPFPYQP